MAERGGQEGRGWRAAGLCKEGSAGVLLVERAGPPPASIPGKGPSSPPPLHCGSPAPLELTVSLPLSVPTHPLPSQQSFLLLTLGAKQPARGEGLAPGRGARQEYCGEGLSLPLAIPLVTTDPILIFLAVA